MNYLTAAHTDIGIRKSTNQDSALVMEAETDVGRVLLTVISLNEDQIRSRDEKKYINELVCPLADNLFFCFNTTDKTGQIFSAKWYGKAADSDLTENKKRVEILSKLSANSKNEDAMDEKGDSAISTSEYWSLLQDLIKSESLSDTPI